MDDACIWPESGVGMMVSAVPIIGNRLTLITALFIVIFESHSSVKAYLEQRNIVMGERFSALAIFSWIHPAKAVFENHLVWLVDWSIECP